MGIGNIRRRVMATLLACVVCCTAQVTYAQERSIEDESIYDVLVDRYFNGSVANDFTVNTQDPASFAGGDFVGLAEKASYIEQLGFTTVSIGSVFATHTYDGAMLTSYETLERHFGTEEELKRAIEVFHEKQIRVMVDVRFNNVSSAHEWLKQHPEWGQIQGGTVTWDYTNEAFQEALQQAIVQFQQTYAFGGLRLTELDGVPTAWLDALIAELRSVTPSVQIVSNGETTAQVDAMLRPAAVTQWSDMFTETSQSTASLPQLLKEAPQMAAVDTLETPRLTYKAAEKNVFPPTRIKVAMGAMLTLPVVPVMTYGTEISMNGADPSTSHQIQNFKVDEEIITYIQDVQSVRNRSAALRTGDFKLLHEDEGFFVFSRSNEEETWIVAVNNTAQTQQIHLPSDILTSNMELSGLFEKDIVRVDENGEYNIVVDREIVELYQAKEAKGFNYTYMGVMAFVYVIFISFIWLLIRRAKRPKTA